MMNEEEKKDDTGVMPPQTPSQTELTSAALNAIGVVAQNQTTERGSQLFINAITAVVHAVARNDTKGDGCYMVTVANTTIPRRLKEHKVVSRTTTRRPDGSEVVKLTFDDGSEQTMTRGEASRIDSVASKITATTTDSEWQMLSETKRTKAAIAAVIKVGKYQVTEPDSQLLVDAIAAAVKAVQNQDTARDAELIVAAVQAAVPDQEELEEGKAKACEEHKETTQQHSGDNSNKERNKTAQGKEPHDKQREKEHKKKGWRKLKPSKDTLENAAQGAAILNNTTAAVNNMKL